MDVEPAIRLAVRVLLLDQYDSVLLFRAEDPETGAAFWFPAGGVWKVTRTPRLRRAAKWLRRRDSPTCGWRARSGIAATCSPGEESGWISERWFLARVARFEPSGALMMPARNA